MDENSSNKKLTDTLAALVMFGLVVAIVAVGFIVFWRAGSGRTAPVEVRIQCVAVDSLEGPAAEYYSRTQVDSLVERMREHERALEQRYMRQQERAEWEDDYKDIVIFGVSLIVAVVGFFGYKSFRDIKDESLQKAKDVAEQTAREAAEQYLRREVSRMVNDELDRTYREQSYQTIVARITQDLTESSVFARAGSVREEVLSILADWTIDIRPETEAGTGGGHETGQNAGAGQQDPTEPFDD